MLRLLYIFRSGVNKTCEMRLLVLAVGVGCACAGLAPRQLRGAFGFDEAARSAANYFTQRVDHFSSNGTSTFQQAFFTNRESFDGTGPVFVYVGGEGPLSSTSATSNFIIDWLPEVKGMLFALEHRYYGCHNASSCPYDPSASKPVLEELRYLTTDQALEDLAAFARHQKQALGLGRNKWVLIGGSYPGMLAAFARARFPDVFDCAVSSSSPVHPVLDFTGFQDTVARGYAMNVEGVRGSDECAEQIRRGHDAVRAALATPDGRAQLASLFPRAVPSAEWLADATNARTFAGCGVATFPAQSNQPTCSTPGCGVSQICDVMTNSSGGSGIERLAALAAVQGAGGADMTHTCDMDWEMPGDVPAAKVNYWGWQCCTEYGFYQTCEVSHHESHHTPHGVCRASLSAHAAGSVPALERRVAMRLGPSESRVAPPMRTWAS
jgi:serine protease 16